MGTAIWSNEVASRPHIVQGNPDLEDIRADVGDAIEQIQAVRAYNDTGGTLARGTIVALTGWGNTTTFDYPKLVKADADSAALYGFAVVDQPILTGTMGIVYRWGIITGDATNVLNTSAAVAGVNLYLSDTAGAFVATIAPVGKLKQKVGVIRYQSATVGSAYFDFRIPVETGQSLPTGTASGDLAGTYPAPTLAASISTAVAFGSGSLTATKPKVITSIDDTFGMELIALAPVGAAAVRELKIANAAAGDAPSLSVENTGGGEANIPIAIDAKGSGTVTIGGVSTGAVLTGGVSHQTGQITQAACLPDAGLVSSLVKEVGSYGVGHARFPGAGIPVATEQLTIGTETYTWVAVLSVPAVPFEVLIGANGIASATNLAASVNLNSLLVKAVSAGTVCCLRSILPGTVGNYALTEVGGGVTDMVFSAANMVGGTAAAVKSAHFGTRTVTAEDVAALFIPEAIVIGSSVNASPSWYSLMLTTSAGVIKPINTSTITLVAISGMSVLKYAEAGIVAAATDIFYYEIV